MTTLVLSATTKKVWGKHYILLGRALFFIGFEIVTTSLFDIGCIFSINYPPCNISTKCYSNNLTININGLFQPIFQAAAGRGVFINRLRRGPKGQLQQPGLNVVRYFNGKLMQILLTKIYLVSSCLFYSISLAMDISE